jgi:hypothetical protein
VIRPSRNKVFWIGGPPPDGLKQMLWDWGLVVVPVTPPLPHSDPALRAVLIWHTAEGTGALRKRLRNSLAALEHGVLVAMVAEEATSFATALHIRAQIVADIERKTTEAFDGLNKVFRLDDAKGARWSEIVRACVDHDPGPAAKLDLTVAGPVTSAEKLLLQRSFARFDKVKLKRQSGGRSGSSVWRVDAVTSHGRRCEPFIAKIGPRLALKEESDRFRENVRDYLPFPNRPSMMAEGYVHGASRAVLCSMFINRAHCFDKYVCLVQHPELVVTSLFDGPLRTWRADRRDVTNSLGNVYIEEIERAEARGDEDKRLGRPNKEVLPKKARLNHAYALAKKRIPSVATPDQIWNALSTLESIPYSNCPCHGDLNARNIFVRSTSVEVVLIDFSHAGDSAAASRDPSRLDVNLGFDVGWKQHPRARMLPNKDLKDLYCPPLLGRCWARDAADGRIEAIRQIRRYVAGEGISETEYRITTACHLLRYARSDGSENTSKREFGAKEESRLRCMSYLLAVRLLGL